MIYDAIIVGGGVSGLTGAAYLAKNGYSTLLLEKESRCGGLVNSFTRNGFTFDGGIRALENAGVMFPMLRHLGIEIEFIKNRVSLGMEDEIIDINSTEDLKDYESMLTHFYPESKAEISQIIDEIKKITHMMDVQYGIDNPLFLDIKKDRDYFLKKVFPWMFKYALNAPKITSRNLPVVPYLEKYTQNQALLDIITQHFFTATPAYFALSYIKLYQVYYYPKGGTGVFVQKLVDYITRQGGEIRTDSAVRSIDLKNKTVRTVNNEEIEYRQLLWAADQKTLYEIIDKDTLDDQNTRDVIQEKRQLLDELVGNDSVLSVYLGVNLDKNYFEKISAGHFFYTPIRDGLTKAGEPPQNGSWDEMKAWLEKFFDLTTYEVSIPVLRDKSLAPEGKSGLIISTLFDYQVTKYIYEQAWEDAFKEYVMERMIHVLDRTVYPHLKENVIESFTSTPMTIQKITGNADGAITGWSFTNPVMPAENRLVRISNSVRTPLEGVTQAGQWTYSPSGFPVSLITGKLAADRIEKFLK
jgi:phytoene dehydrogenase-like protein